MSSRHRDQRRPAVVPPPKISRQEEHRRLRRTVHTDLHLTSIDESLADDLPFEQPHHTRGYLAPDELPPPMASVGSRRFRHWKQPFWKRRSNVRRSRNAALADLV